MSRDETRPLGQAAWKSEDARVSVEGRGFRVQLEGDEAFVRSAWAALRPELLRKVEASRRLAALEEAQRRARPEPTDDTDDNPGPLLVHERHDLYEKALVAQRGALGRSVIGGVVDVGRLARVWVEHGQLERLSGLLGPAQQAWSRLTAEGRRKFGGAG